MAWEPDCAVILDLSLISSVISVKSLYLSEPQFPPLSSYDKCLLRAWYVQASVLGAGNAVVDKTDNSHKRGR